MNSAFHLGVHYTEDWGRGKYLAIDGLLKGPPGAQRQYPSLLQLTQAWSQMRGPRREGKWPPPEVRSHISALEPLAWSLSGGEAVPPSSAQPAPFAGLAHVDALNPISFACCGHTVLSWAHRVAVSARCPGHDSPRSLLHMLFPQLGSVLPSISWEVHSSFILGLPHRSPYCMLWLAWYLKCTFS